MDRCPNCGNKINSMDVLCPKCGSVIEEVRMVFQKPAQPAQAPPQAPRKPEFPPHLVVYNEDLPEDMKPKEEPQEPVSEPEEIKTEASPSLSEEALLLRRLREIESKFESEEDEEDSKTGSYVFTRDSGEETRRGESGGEARGYEQSGGFSPKLSGLADDDYGEANSTGSDESLPYIGGAPRGEAPEPGGSETTGHRYRSRDAGGQNAEPGGHDEEPFFQGLLKRINEAPLPESESRRGFNPEDFMRRYKLNRRMYGYKPLSGERSEPLKRTAPPEPESAGLSSPPPPMAPAQSAKSRGVELSEIHTERSFRAKDGSGALEGFTIVERRYGHTPPSENGEAAPEIQRRYKGGKKAKRPEKPSGKREEKIKVSVKTHRKLPAVLSFLIWAAVTAAIFAGFLYFDNYVRSSYGDYGSFIYSVTGGKINFGNVPASK